MKAVVRKADDRFATELSQNFKWNGKMFWKEVKRVWKGVQGEEMRVKDSDGNILVEGKAVRRRWAKYFDELLNVQEDVQASVLTVGGDRRMLVLGRLNGRWVGQGIRKRSEWWDYKVRLAVLHKRRVFEQWLQKGTEQAFDEHREERRRVKALVSEAEDRFGAKLSQGFEGNRKIFWKEVKRVRKGSQGEET